jgi:DUF1365 family protein
MGLNSCLYECSVMHHRLLPKEHHFEHSIFMFYLDLDELDQVAQKLFLFGRNRSNFYSFRDADHLPTGSGNLKENVLAYLSRNGVDVTEIKRIMLLTLPRVLGYVFNPVSFYFCFNAKGAPVCAIAEVGNTFREMKLFLLRREEMTENQLFRQITPKHFYVSPFSNLDLSFDFKLRPPGEKLEIHVDDCDGNEKTLMTTLTGRRAALTNARLSWFSLKYPLVTLKVIFLIHWHALLLYLKKVPFHRKAANPAMQCDVLNPHSSLTGRIK